MKDLATITFDTDGNLKTVLDDLLQKSTGLNHLIFHAHGFNNDSTAANNMGNEYFVQMTKILGTLQPNSNNIGYCLVHWPSVAPFTEFGNMAARAEKVGAHGLADVVNKVKQANPGVNIHLSGHSLGARLAAWSLKGLKTKVQSLFLIQGAFPAWAFAYNVFEATSLESMGHFISGLFGGDKHDLRGALADARANATWIGATFSYKDLMLWGYCGGSTPVHLISHIPAALLAKLIVPSLDQIPKIVVPAATTLVDNFPVGLLGMMDGTFQRLEMDQDVRPVGTPYPGLGAHWTSFDFTSEIGSDHDSYRTQKVAWAHLQLGRFI